MYKKITVWGMSLVVVAMVLASCAPAAAPTAAPVAPAAPVATTAPAQKGLCKPEEIRYVQSMREMAQPYHAGLDKGGKLFVEWVGASPDQYVLQLNQGDSDKQVSLMSSILAENAKCSVFNIEPNADTVIPRMVDVGQETGAYVVGHWAAPEGYYPFSHDHYAAMVSVNSFEAGYQLAVGLFKAMGGKGNIFAVEGFQATSVAMDRYDGLQKALKEYPDIILLEHQPADWDRKLAFPIVQTWLTKHPDVNGIWAANDDMGLGALEALREKGLAGKVLVAGIDGIPEAVKAVKDGEFAMTIASDATYQGSIGFALGYCLLTGEIPLPKDWKNEQRMFYLTLAVITKENVDKFLSDPKPADYESTWKCDGLWSRSTGPSYPEGAK